MKKSMIEAFKAFEVGKDINWNLDWMRSVGGGLYDALEFRNAKLNQIVRIETYNDVYRVRIWKNSVLIDEKGFENFDEAKGYVTNYIMKNSVTDSLLAQSLYKKGLKEASARGIEHEEGMLIDGTIEYLRVLNMITNNSYIDPELIKKAEEIKQFILSKNLT
jgi:hypothetical protein